jgi:sulfate transport system substrate-binding protein
MNLKPFVLTLALVTGAFGFTSSIQAAESVSILNVSYDPTRELYQEFNAAFAKHWQAKTGQTVKILQSHGGSSKQARAVIDGNGGRRRDTGTGLRYRRHLRESRAASGKLAGAVFPTTARPTSPTITFLVRKGNPKGIKDWSDLVKPESPSSLNPKTSGVARWNYLAAWAML